MSESQAVLTRLDIGCGKNKKAGFIGIDQYAMPGVDVVCDVSKSPLPYEADSVDEVHCSHFLEHLTQEERCFFLNELYRVMKPGAKATVITPHWASNRAYGDPTHKWPAIGEMFFYYLSADWRKTQAPHTDIEFNPQGYGCNFAATWGYAMHPDLQLRNLEYQQFALQNYKESALDTHATLTKV